MSLKKVHLISTPSGGFRIFNHFLIITEPESPPATIRAHFFGLEDFLTKK